MSSGFVSENEIAERKRIRQAEWEKVRKPDQPLEAPEESYDSRTLFERLEEQRKKKEYEYEETHKLKNMIKGLDNDEVDFLELVDKQKFQEEQRVKDEERNVLLQFRHKVASLEEKTAEERIKHEIAPAISSIKSAVANSSSSKKSSQKKLLAGAIVKKRSGETSPTEPPSKQSRKLFQDVLESETVDDNASEEKSESTVKATSEPIIKETTESNIKEPTETTIEETLDSTLKETSESTVEETLELNESQSGDDGRIIYQSALYKGGYLPCCYPPSDSDSSDSERSSDTESDNAVLNWDTDLFGRKFGEN